MKGWNVKKKESSDLGYGGRNLAARPEFKEGQIQVFGMGKGKKELEGADVWKPALGLGRKKLGAEEVGYNDK